MAVVLFSSHSQPLLLSSLFLLCEFYRAVQKRNHHYLLIHLRLWFPRQETPQIRCQLFFWHGHRTTHHHTEWQPILLVCFFRHELNKIVLCDRRVNIALVGAECVNIRHTGGRDYRSMRSHLCTVKRFAFTCRINIQRLRKD